MYLIYNQVGKNKSINILKLPRIFTEVNVNLHLCKFTKIVIFVLSTRPQEDAGSSVSSSSLHAIFNHTQAEGRGSHQPIGNTRKA